MFTGAGKHQGNGLYAESKSRFLAYTDTLSGRSSGLTWTLQQPRIDQDLPDAFPRFRAQADHWAAGEVVRNHTPQHERRLEPADRRGRMANALISHLTGDAVLPVLLPTGKVEVTTAIRSTGPSPLGGVLAMSGDEIQPSWLPHRTGVHPYTAAPRIVTWLPKDTVVMMPPERLGWFRQLALAAPAVSM